MEQQLVDLYLRGEWVLLAAIAIGIVVRLLKADSKLIPAVVPAKWRPWLAIGLGIGSGVLEAVATGKPWKSALVGGLVSGVLPILGHELVVESLRSGKEIGGDKPTEPPAPQAPSITGGGILLALCFALALTGTACSMSFEEARLAGIKARPMAASASAPAARDDSRCRELDDARMRWSAIAKSAGVVSGGTGLATIPVDPKVRPYVAAGSIGALVIGAYALVMSEGSAAAWARDCQ